MPELIAKNVRIYKVPSRDFDTSEGHPAFISMSYSTSYAYGYLLEERPEIKKTFEILSGDSVFLDELYSISDIKFNPTDIESVGEKLPESYSIRTLSKKEFEERYKQIRDKFEKGPMNKDTLKGFQDEISALRKLKGEYDLGKHEMMYLIQLTNRGWVHYNEPVCEGIGIRLLRILKSFGLIEYQGFKDGRAPYYVKLTKKGASLKEKFEKMVETKTDTTQDQ